MLNDLLFPTTTLMFPYFLMLVVVLWMAITHMAPQLPSEMRQRLGLAWPFFFMFIALLVGFRHEVGGDWEAYLEQVAYLRGEKLHPDILKSDPAYALLNWIGANVGGGVYFVNLVCASIFCYGLIVFCRALPRPWLALLVAVPYLVTVVAMGYTRQAVAIGLAMMAIARLMNGSLLRFIAWIAVAALFHKSAVILVPFAVFARTKHRVLTIGGVAISATILFILLLQEYLDGMFVQYIDAEYSSSGGPIRVAMNALPAAIFLIFKNRFNLDSQTRGFWLWIAWSALMFVPLFVMSPSSTAVDRLALYWIPLQIFIWSRLPDAFGVSGQRNPVWVVGVTAYSALVMIVWLFFADHSHAWLPYRFYPWEAIWA